MRACTLATFELVTTLPETVSPGWTVVSLTATARICGAALGGRRGTLAETFGGVTAGDGVAVGAVVGEGEGVPTAGAGVGAAWTFVTAARCEAAGRGRVVDAGDGCPERTAWLQPASQSKAAPIATAGRTFGMPPSSWTPRAFRHLPVILSGLEGRTAQGDMRAETLKTTRS